MEVKSNRILSTILSHLTAKGDELPKKSVYTLPSSPKQKVKYHKVEGYKESKQAFSKPSKFSSVQQKLLNDDNYLKSLLREWPMFNDDPKHSNFRSFAPKILANEKFCRTKVAPELREDIRNFMCKLKGREEISMKEMRDEILVPLILSVMDKVFGVFEESKTNSEYAEIFKDIHETLECLSKFDFIFVEEKTNVEKRKGVRMRTGRWQESVIREQ